MAASKLASIPEHFLLLGSHSSQHHLDEEEQEQEKTSSPRLYKTPSFGGCFNRNKLLSSTSSPTIRAFETLQHRSVVWWDDDAIRFATRVSVLISIASIFATNQVAFGKDADGNNLYWPQGMWVLLSTLMVCWFPAMDVASVAQKSLYRLLGTCLGGTLALLVGTLSRLILPSYDYQRAIFLHSAYAILSFAVTYASVKIKVTRKTTFVQKYSYVTVLCLLTFTITLFPFLEQQDPWKKALWRIVNVTFGIFIALIGSMLIVPRSTHQMLLQKIVKQCTWAGQSSEAVLHAAADVVEEAVTTTTRTSTAAINGGEQPSPGWVLDANATSSSESIIRNDDTYPSNRRGSGFVPLSRRKSSFGSIQQVWESIRVSQLHLSFGRLHHEFLEDNPNKTTLDVVLETYDAAIRDFKDTKALFAMFWFDPFYWFVPTSMQFQNDCATILENALRVQTTVVLLDGILRNDTQHHASFLNENQCNVLTEMGTLIRKMLTVPRISVVDASPVATIPGESSALLPPPGSIPTKTSTIRTLNDTFKDRLLYRLNHFRDSVDELATRIILQKEQGQYSGGGSNNNNNNSSSTLAEYGINNNNTNDHPQKTSNYLGSKHYALLFLQLVEHLVHRSISLYDSWVALEQSSLTNAMENGSRHHEADDE